MITSDFKKYYALLNLEQRKAVDSIEGPVMVIAGPGTGKTQILTLRIANILAKTDTPAEAILAVTFTEAGVIAMRKRLAEIIGSQAYEVAITTFHGFAHGIIQKYPESFPRIIGSANITEADQVRIMEEVIEGAKGLKILRPFGDRFHYLGDVLDAIQTLKREGIGSNDLEKIVEREAKAFTSRDDLFHLKGAHKGKMKGEFKDLEKQIEKNRELAMLYEAYQDALTEQKLYDFDDMIMEVLSALMDDGELLLALQEQYQYVLVDEHQDTNNAQNRILELLMSYHDNPNLFIVGDEKQAIFRFQGASLENFHYFKNKFADAKLITLTQNYRSTQTVLDAAKTNLTAKAGHPEAPIQILEASTSDSELYMIVSDIKQKIAKKTDAAEIAILYRTNRDALPLARMCEKLDVPYHIESDLDILSDPDIHKLVLIFEALDQFGDLERLIRVLYLDIWNIDPLEVHRFVSEKKDFKTTFLEVYKKLSRWKTIAHNTTLLDLFDAVVQESGLLQSMLARSDSFEALEKLGVFLDYIRRAVENHEGLSLEDFMESLQRMKEHRILLRGALAGRTPGKVRLMTAHRAKGLEFEHVYIINCFDGHWGGRRHMEKLKLLEAIYRIATQPTTPSALPLIDKGESEGDSDEKNLFYVAITRAKKTLTISYAHLALDQREQLPSQFIGDLKPELIEYVDVKAQEEDFKKHRDVLFAASASQAGEPDIKNLEFVRELFKKRGFAVTHLNNYLKCPWQYFFVNLLRIPKAPEPPQMYGMAVHAALRNLLSGETAQSKKYLILQFEKHLAVQPLSASFKEDYRVRGVAALKGYYDTYEKTWTHPILPEFPIKGIELTPDILLTGVIDKLELLDALNHVAVTDYKTGKTKSRNEIEGKTRAADVGYYRQLVFYNLLLNKSGKYKMQEGIIDFVEPSESGKYKKEVFEIGPAEVADLEVLIKDTADKILNLAFWNDTCGEPDCEWCGLRQMMK